MTVNAENGLSLMSRLRPIEEPIDPEVMANSLVFVIEIDDELIKSESKFKSKPESDISDLFDTNGYIHYICKNIFDKYSKYKSIINSSNDENMDPHNGSQEENKLLSNSQKAMESLQLNGSSEELNDSNDEKNPLIIIIDAFQAFNLQHFSTLISNVNQLKQMVIMSVSDETAMLSAIANELPVHLGLNRNLKLVVIYSISSEQSKDINDELNKVLSSLTISVPFFVIVDNITKPQSNQMKELMFELISIKHLDCNRVEIKTNRHKTKVIKDLTKSLIS